MFHRTIAYTFDDLLTPSDVRPWIDLDHFLGWKSWCPVDTLLPSIHNSSFHSIFLCFLSYCHCLCLVSTLGVAYVYLLLIFFDKFFFLVIILFINEFFLLIEFFLKVLNCSLLLFLLVLYDFIHLYLLLSSHLFYSVFVCFFIELNFLTIIVNFTFFNFVTYLFISPFKSYNYFSSKNIFLS